jgi:hypothetical protein
MSYNIALFSPSLVFLRTVQSYNITLFNIVIFITLFPCFFFLLVVFPDNVIYFLVSTTFCMGLINRIRFLVPASILNLPITKLNDWGRQFDCRVHISTIRSVILNIKTLVSVHKMYCFVAFNIIIF